MTDWSKFSKFQTDASFKNLRERKIQLVGDKAEENRGKLAAWVERFNEILDWSLVICIVKYY